MNIPAFVRRAAATSAFGIIGLVSFAQQPAAPAAAAGAPAAPGRGGGGAAAPAAPAMALGQRIAVGQLNDSVADLQAKATAAAAALAKEAFALPKNQSLITRRAKELSDADQALATARAVAFEKIQASPNKLSPEQKTTLTGGGGGGGGGGGRGGGGGGGGGGRGGGPVPYNDYTGFTKIFDGKTLKGWDGEDGVWDIIDGTLHMDVAKPGSGGQHHIHYVGGPGLPPNVFGDFDLKFEFQQSASGNGGVQYHSRLLNMSHSADGKDRGVYDPKVMADPFGKPLPAGVRTVADAQKAGFTGNPWQVSGYQYDIVAPAMGGMAQFYEGQGSRFILTSPGNIVQTYPGGVVTVIGTIQAEGQPNASAQFSKPLEWNQAEIIARGHVFIHMQNGHVLTVTTDDDPYRWAKSGMMSLQCEGGWISYRNVYLKIL